MGYIRRVLTPVVASVFFALAVAGTAHAVCGDGIPDVGELCDDNNLVDGDGCDANCTPTGCGNGITTAGETCDDGNLVNDDGCDDNCTATACGNGVLTSGEVCDDANVTDGDGCDSNCTPTGCPNFIPTAPEACDDGPGGSTVCDPDCTAVACGDGTTNPLAVPSEQCDDGNVSDGDGCDSDCTLTTCGNGITTSGESCDDGNLVSGDGCDANCTPTSCGNGIPTAGETCDDGNLASGDGCDANCTVTTCGNGIQTAPEQCDDGNLANADGCDANCTPTACGNSIITAPEQCDDGNLVSNDGCDSNCTAPACGNGVLNPPEVCDDNNLVNADGCDANCTVTACGNGIVTPPDVCDDGNLVSGDGCDANCTVTGCGNGIVTVGEACDDGNPATGDGCRPNCTVELCGDGTIDPPSETCDDGNLVSGDGCDANCLPSGCGNGIVTAGEQCDDGNVVNGDTCSSECQRELLNPVPAAGDRFGAAIAAAGSNLIIGVPLHDQSDAINTGLAYLYSGTTFQPIRTFQNPTADPGDEFGFAVAALGQNVLVGAPFDSTNGNQNGAVHLFNGATGALIRTIVNPDATGSKHFGWSLAALNTTNVLISAPYDDTGLSGGGVVYLYNALTGTILQVFVNPNPAANEDFGFAVSGAGSNVLIGAPGHDIPGSGFNQPAPNAGAVYLFDIAAGSVVKEIANPIPIDTDRFGQAVATIGPDLLVSSPGHVAGAVYRINATTGAVTDTYVPQGAFGNDAFGAALAVVGGDKVAIGIPLGNLTGQPATGIVQVFDADTSALVQTISKAAPAQGDDFGTSLAVTGASIVVGTPRDDTVDFDAGAVYFFPDNSCGDGLPNAGEQCDDGNLVNADGCDANCTITSCGNGEITVPEQCDDGNNLAGDGCSAICGLEGACGDNVVSPFEQCDDGNVVSGDGCDSNCTFTTCGNGIVAGPEQCDAGVLGGSDLCCSATCQRLDTDADGVCDRDDVCPNTPDPGQSNLDGDIFGDACDICPSDVNNDSDGDRFCIGTAFNPPAFGGGDPCSRPGLAGTWTKPKALFLKLGAPGGDDALRLKGIFTIGNTLPAIDPSLYGVHLRVTDRNGNIIVDETIPGGNPSPLRGWKAVGSPPNQWVFTDRTKPAVQNGIGKVIIRNRSFIDPKLYSVAIQGNKGTYPLLPGGEPVQVTVELNPLKIPRGGTPGRDQCGEMRFLQVGKPTCKFVKFKVICR